MHAVLFDKGEVEIDPDQASLDRVLADRQVVDAALRRVMLEQIGDLFPVVGMNGAHGAVLQPNTFLLGALHHLGKFPGAPDGLIGAVLRDAHHHGVVVQRLEQLLIKIIFEIQQGGTLRFNSTDFKYTNSLSPECRPVKIFYLQV